MRFSQGYQIITAVFFGIFCGLFFGPQCSVLKPVTTTFTMLLQVVVLPYLSFSLIHGIGSMTPLMGKKIFKSGWPFLVLLWGLIYLLVYLVKYLIPKPTLLLISAESSSLGWAENLLNFIIPKNPFYDLVNGIVPAIVIFSIVFGMGLMHTEKKENLCNLFERMIQAIERTFVWVADIAPIGAFAHIAYAAGTIRFENLYKIEFYIGAYILISLFVTFGIFPVLISSLTRLSYREVLSAIRFVCIVPFVLGLAQISIPFLYAYLRKMGRQSKEMNANLEESSQVILPVTYIFGQIGNSMLIVFILFLSFYYRHPFTGSEQWLLFLLMIPMSLGSSSTSLGAASFLIKELGFPAGALELYIETSVLTNNFQVLMSVASVLTLIILTLYAFHGLLEIKYKQLCFRLGTALALFICLIISLKFNFNLEDHYEDLYFNLKISDVIENPVQSVVLREGEGSSRFFGETKDPRKTVEMPFRQIFETRVLKVGFGYSEIPYDYLNFDKELVGYDIAYAYQLAKDLDCVIEFVPIRLDSIGPDLKSGLYDIAMSAFVMSEGRLREMDFTHPYQIQNNVLVVSASSKDRFLNLQAIINTEGIKIISGGAFIDIAKRHFPKATIIPSFNLDRLVGGEANAVIWNRVSAMIWCLTHPGFVVIDYNGRIGKSYLSYPVRSGSLAFQAFLNEWLLLKQQSGFETEMYNYWIEGKPAKPRQPRWSILHNSLHIGK